MSGNTSHFVLLAFAIPGHTWKAKDEAISAVKRDFGVESAEIHAAWLNRRYAEQESIPGFAAMDHDSRRTAVARAREAMLIRRATLRGVGSIRSMKANFRKTDAYTHLTFDERNELLLKAAEVIGGWADATIFADCIDKQAWSRRRQQPTGDPFEEAFDQVVSRFHHYLRRQHPEEYGLLVQDRNETVAARLTALMREFHQRGTTWTNTIPLLVETPLFVDSHLTSMVQVADLCSYALRRYLENGEESLFNHVFPRGDTFQGRRVGVRHYRGGRDCRCRMCEAH